MTRQDTLDFIKRGGWFAAISAVVTVVSLLVSGWAMPDYSIELGIVVGIVLGLPATFVGKDDLGFTGRWGAAICGSVLAGLVILLISWML